ncbi:MAG: spore maturation protein [bacterium]
MLLKTLEILSEGTVPLLIAGILLVAHWRGVNVFESFIQGAQEGFTTAVRIIPQLVAMFVAIDLLRLSGALDLVTKLLNPLLSLGGVPPDILPLVLTRSLSGSAAFGLTVDLINTHGPDSFIGRLASTMQGSTDTTFYILAVYFGAVGIKKPRHALFAGLMGDLAGFLASLYICQLAFGP